MIRLMPYASAAVAAAYLSWSATDYMLKADMAAMNDEHKKQMLAVVQAGAREIELARKRVAKLQDEISSIDSRYQGELTRAETETARLRDAVDRDSERLHILAKRPRRCPEVPTTTNGSGMGDGEAVELDGAAKRAYFNLRAGIESDTTKLNACQAILDELLSQRDDNLDK